MDIPGRYGRKARNVVFRSIRWKLTASYVILALLTAATFSLLSLFLIRSTVARQERDYLISTAQSIAQEIEPFLGEDLDVDEAQALIDTVGFLGDVRISVLDVGKTPILRSAYGLRMNLTALSTLQPDRVTFATEERRPWPTIVVGRAGEPHTSQERRIDLQLSRRLHGLIGQRFVLEETESRPAVETTPESAGRPPAGTAAPRQAHGEFPEPETTVPVGTAEAPVGYIQLSHGSDLGKTTLDTARSAVGLAAAGAVLVAALAGLVMGRRLTSPIVALTSSVRAMSRDDMSVRAPEGRKDEIGRLARQFNRMAERLESSFREIERERDTLKRFIEDASHELRTPVTAMKTFLELLLGKARSDAALRERFLLESQTQLQRLESIISDLLDLSRLDGGLDSLALTRAAAGEILASAVHSTKPEAERKGVRITNRTPGRGPTLICDRGRLETALVNLLDNAVKYSSSGSSVEARWEEQGAWAAFQVKDRGRGIEAEDLPHIFDRFYRARDCTEEGSGLGLAIVQSVVRNHGGTVEAENRDGGGTVVTIRVPRDHPETSGTG
jgi:signal transduction histidine kinase